MAVEIALISAMDERRNIGRNNKLLWRLPEDMKFFRRMTKGHPVVMGRRTFESIGRPLPDRRNIVLTRDAAYAPQGVETAGSVEEALALAGDATRLCVIGGGVVYEAFLPLANVMYLTHLDHVWEGDARFPAWIESEWKVVWEEDGQTNADNPYSYRFREYRRA